MFIRAAALLATTMAATCEVQEPRLGPGGFSADSIKVSHDNVDVDCVIGTFRNDNHLHFIIDQDCDGAADYIKRSDGVLYQVRPILDGTGLVDHSMLIEDADDPFAGTTAARWLTTHGLAGVGPGERFRRPIRVHTLSTSSGRAELTLGMTSDMQVPCFHTHGLAYSWRWLDDPDSDRDCWMLRIRGGLDGVVRWLAGSGVQAVEFRTASSLWALRWNRDDAVVEILRDGTIVERVVP